MTEGDVELLDEVEDIFQMGEEVRGEGYEITLGFAEAGETVTSHSKRRPEHEQGLKVKKGPKNIPERFHWYANNGTSVTYKTPEKAHHPGSTQIVGLGRTTRGRSVTLFNLNPTYWKWKGLSRTVHKTLERNIFSREIRPSISRQALERDRDGPGKEG